MAPVEAELTLGESKPPDKKRIEPGAFKKLDLPPFHLSVVCDRGDNLGILMKIDGPASEPVEIRLIENDDEPAKKLERRDPIKFSGKQKVEIKTKEPKGKAVLAHFKGWGIRDEAPVEDRELVPV